MVGRINRWSRVAHHLVRTDIHTDRGSIGASDSLRLGRCIRQACLTESRLTQQFRVIVDRSQSTMGYDGIRAGGDNYMAKWLFAALLVLQAHFAASYLVPLD